MTDRDEVLRMAREAGRIDWAQEKGNVTLDQVFERFAALVYAKGQRDMRERAAEVCDEKHWPWRIGDDSGPKECAEAIRALEVKS